MKEQWYNGGLTNNLFFSAFLFLGLKNRLFIWSLNLIAFPDILQLTLIFPFPGLLLHWEAAPHNFALNCYNSFMSQSSQLDCKLFNCTNHVLHVLPGTKLDNCWLINAASNFLPFECFYSSHLSLLGKGQVQQKNNFLN